MAWFERGGLPPEEYRELSAAAAGPVRVLAWARGEGTLAVGLAGRLAIRDGSGWAFVAWEQIDRGGWDPDSGELRWQGEAVSGQVALAEPGRLPDLFRERVTASILLQQPVELGRGRRAMIVARRSPEGSGGISWRVTPPADGLRDGEAPTVDEALAQLRAEYDIA